jgi:hypothetical protein
MDRDAVTDEENGTGETDGLGRTSPFTARAVIVPTGGGVIIGIGAKTHCQSGQCHRVVQPSGFHYAGSVQLPEALSLTDSGAGNGVFGYAGVFRSLDHTQDGNSG